VGRWWGERRTRARRVGAMRVEVPIADVPEAEGPSVGGPPRDHDGAIADDVHHPARAGMIVASPTDVSSPLAPARPLGIASSSKTWMGTAACAIATTIGTLLVARLGVVESLLAGALAAAAERPVWRFDDNLRIVLAVGAGILLCRFAFS
jgi:hypothetical protein